MSTHSIDARQLLRELEHDSDDDWLAVHWGAEEFRDGHFLFHGHLHCFFLHLLNIITHVFTATQTHQCYKKRNGSMKSEDLSMPIQCVPVDKKSWNIM